MKDTLLNVEYVEQVVGGMVVVQKNKQSKHGIKGVGNDT